MKQDLGNDHQVSLVVEEIVELEDVGVLTPLDRVQVAQNTNLVQRLVEKVVSILNDLGMNEGERTHLQTQVLVHISSHVNTFDCYREGCLSQLLNNQVAVCNLGFWFHMDDSFW